MAKIRRKKLTPEEKEHKALKKRIRQTFTQMGFSYLRTENITVSFGGQGGEFDSIFVFENIVLICEDTISKSRDNVKTHIKEKHAFFEQVAEHKGEFIKWLKDYYPDKLMGFSTDYTLSRYKLRFLYFHKSTIDDDTKRVFNKIAFVDDNELWYFKRVADCVKHTGRNELFEFLQLNSVDVGSTTHARESSDINTVVILPEESSGFHGIKLITFVMSAEDLMQCSYVLRKDSWGWNEKMELYQRLLIPDKIRKIREYLATEKMTFANNIIVSLPDAAEIYRMDNGRKVVLDLENDDVSEHEHLKMHIANTINSIGIIDGQHRVFAYHEGSNRDPYEPVIRDLRRNKHLIVTGIKYKKGTRRDEKIKLESDLFLLINSTQKTVASDLLQHIRSIQEPSSPIGISRLVLIRMNAMQPFLDLFQIHPRQTERIKTSSIVQWGLKDLVAVDQNDDRTLFNYWHHDKKEVLLKGPKEGAAFDAVLEEYIKFCATTISNYFSAVREVFPDDWSLEEDKRLLGVTSITGFLIAFRGSLILYKRINDREFYRKRLRNLAGEVVFRKGQFSFVSSQWRKFGLLITEKCWEP